MVGPTSSTVTSSASDAAAMASTDPNAAARARAAVGPMCRIDRATRIRHSGRCRASSRLASSLVAFAVSVPPLVTKNGHGGEGLGGQPEQVALVCHQPGVEQGDRGLVAKHLDVQGSPAGQVEQPLPQLRGARPGVRASPVDAALLARQRGAARRAVRRELERPLCARAQVDHGPDHLRDDVAGLAQDHHVADEHALARDLVGVVQASRSRPWTR